MKEVQINLNDHVKVKLTDYGWRLYYEMQNKFPKLEKFTWEEIHARADEEGYITFQWWLFMSDFGRYIGFGNDPILETLFVKIKESDITPCNK